MSDWHIETRDRSKPASGNLRESDRAISTLYKVSFAVVSNGYFWCCAINLAWLTDNRFFDGPNANQDFECTKTPIDWATGLLRTAN
jgi:hypothetical protein